MKKSIFKVALVFSIVLYAFQSNCQTTQEEYNYITKGYKVQIESGLDMKKGYSLKDLGDWGLNKGTEKRSCFFKALIREGQSKPCAIMMIYKRTDISNGAEYYICIPSINSSDEIWQQTLDFINTNFKDNNSMLQTIIWGLMKFSSYETSI